jgi:tRNA(His) guanylyltransferase
MSNTDAENLLKGTVAADKNELLFSRFQVNYNNEPSIFRKGSVLFRDYELEVRPVDRVRETDDMSFGGSTDQEISKTQAEKTRKTKAKAMVVIKHIDLINDEFWERRPWIVSGKPGRPVNGTTT